MADKKKKKTGFMLAFWVLVALVVFILFLVKKDDIFTNLKNTGFMEKVFGKTPEYVQSYPEKEKKPGKNDLSSEEPLVIEVTPKSTKSETPKVTVVTEEKTAEKDTKPAEEKLPNPVSDPEEKPVTAKPIVEEKKEEVKTERTGTPAEKPAEKPKAKTDLNLCFIQIDANGSINRKMVVRSVNKTDSPLTEAIKLVIEGPDTMNSSEKDLITLVPEGTRLLGASVKDGVATLNFNEAFSINPVGVEGYRGQLMQIVYTATAFSTVKKVQFLIDGEKQEFLGEAQWIGAPLAQNSF